MKTQCKYKRVLLKLSGEAFQAVDGSAPLDFNRVMEAARKIKEAWNIGVEFGIVTGGGNIIRGATLSGGLERTTADNMGMIGTIVNSLALRDAFKKLDVPTAILSALNLAGLTEPFNLDKAETLLKERYVLIFAAGTGHPFFTTDTAAALRASEIKADALLKGTKVDGVYSSDPNVDPSAVRYKTLTYMEALNKSLKVMDATAFSMCMDNKMPIIVFNFFEKDSLLRVLKGESVGTLIS